MVRYWAEKMAEKLENPMAESSVVLMVEQLVDLKDLRWVAKLESSKVGQKAG